MKALSLFSGIGGIDLAGEWAGIETVAFCEREPFCQKVLKKHWPDTPIYDDVCTLTKERLEADEVIVRGQSIDLIHGGFPCQPFSTAGLQKGRDDDRDLWPEMFRIIQEFKPDWVVGENVANFVNMELERTLTDLESEGYETQAFIIPACGVNAKHQRNRVFVVAHYSRIGMEGRSAESVLGQPIIQIGQTSESFSEAERRYDTFESRLCRSLHRIPNGVDRIKSLGNSVVPAQVYPILAAIKQIDDQWRAGA